MERSVQGLLLAHRYSEIYDTDLLLSCPSHNVLPHPGTCICPLCDGDEVFGGAVEVVIVYGSPQSQLTDCVLSI